MEVTHQQHPALTEAIHTLQKWVEEHQQAGYDPVPTLTRLAEIIEAETENYMKMDPDPFDDRHPSRADPSCSLGQILKVLFRRDLFMTKLVNDYLRDNYWERLGMPERDSRQLNISVCRLVLDIMPGLEASAVFQEMEGLILRLFSWAEKSIEPLQSYATGLLASAMEVQDIAANFREQNAKLVPLMLQRLHKLQSQMAANPYGQSVATNRPFAHLGADDLKVLNVEGTVKGGVEEGGGIKSPDSKKFSLTPKKGKGLLRSIHNGAIHSTFPNLEDESAMDTGEMVNGVSGEEEMQPKRIRICQKRKSTEGPTSRVGTSPFAMPESPPQSHQWTHPSGTSPAHVHPALTHPPPSVGECSNSSWAEMESYVIGNVQIFPPTLSTRQILILRYLTPMGEYQEFLSHVFEHNALELILKYTNVRETKDARLAFEGLKYLAALLCHKKFSIEFINMQGLQRLLEVPRPSVSATGVSMCLYYLAYCEDAIERVCLLPRHIVADLVRYSLWLLECSHDSGRCHATMFFGLSFQFRIILEEFDAQDGLRKLYNVVSTLPILSIEEDATLNEDEECAARQIVRHVCMALKRYFEAHLAIRVEQVKRATLRDQPMSPPGSGCEAPTPNGDSPPGSPNYSLVPSNALHSHAQSAWPPYKAMKWSSEEVQARVTTLLELMPMRAHWAPVEELLRLGGVTLLLQIIAFTYEWNYSGRAETVRSALDVLSVCCVMPRVQSVLCERVELPEESVTVGMTIVLGAAEGEIVADPDVQRAALNVIANCVCAPIHRTSGVIGRYSVSGSSRKRTSALRSSEELIGRVWESVRSNNGIMILLQLMTVKTPITDADSIRALACRALAGLARSETVRQIVSKLPMFTGGQIQTLLRDPILQDKRQEHVKFQRHALELLERVSGKAKPHAGPDPHFDVSLNNIHRADVVAQTRITFNEQQLIQLIYKHLSSKGFTESAAALQRESGLPLMPPTLRGPNPAHHFPPFSYRSALALQTPVPALPSTPTTPLSSRSLRTSNNLSSSSGQAPSTVCNLNSSSSASSNTPSGNTPSTTSINQPIKVNLSSSRKLEKHPSVSGSLIRNLEKQTTASPLLAPNSASSPVPPSSLSTVAQYNPSTSSANFPTTPLASTSHQLTTPHHVPSSCLAGSFQQHPPPGLTLDSIITEYLMNQHALCKNPMVTCPEFNLFVPHKCPDPNMRNAVPANVAMRLTRRPVYPPYGGHDGARLDRRLVHSRFFPIRSFRLVDDEGFFTCCQFLPDDQTIVMGTFQGEVKLFNMHSAVEESSFQCHDSYVYHMAANREGTLLLTSSTWRRPLSALWSVNKYIDMKFAIEEEEYVEFSKLNQDKIIGTKGQSATIYDVATAQKLMTLFPAISNQYTKNRATFSPSDELILSDGVLWDASTGKKVHKFDKLNQTLSGVFHPNGLEVVSNTEVWDLRTFHLLRTVPALDQCEVVFAPGGGVSVPPTAIYTVSLEQESEEDPSFESSFKTLDAYDYSSIATIDVKRNIYYLCVNRLDTQIAVVENLGMFDSVQESTVRLYDVGRRKDDEDEGEDEEEEDMDGASEDGSDGSGSGSDDDDNDDDDDDSFEANNILGDWEQQNNGEEGRRRHRRNRRNRRRARGGAGGAAGGIGEEGSAAEDAANQDDPKMADVAKKGVKKEEQKVEITDAAQDAEVPKKAGTRKVKKDSGDGKKKTKKGKKSDAEKENFSVNLQSNMGSQMGVGFAKGENEAKEMDEEVLSGICLQDLRETYCSQASKPFQVDDKDKDIVAASVSIRDLKKSFESDGPSSESSDEEIDLEGGEGDEAGEEERGGVVELQEEVDGVFEAAEEQRVELGAGSANSYDAQGDTDDMGSDAPLENCGAENGSGSIKYYRSFSRLEQRTFGNFAIEKKRAKSLVDLRRQSETPSQDVEGGYFSPSNREPIFTGVSVKALRASYCNLVNIEDTRSSIRRNIDSDQRSSFSKFDELTKKTVIHVKSVDSAKVQKQFNEAAAVSSTVGPSLCRSCCKQVFQMEQIKAERAVWHKNCFRCKECSKQLTVDIYSSHEGQLYCKPHFKELFKPKVVVETENVGPVRPRKPEMIIRENQPVELPPDVVRASDKPDLGLEELSSLNVKSRFRVFEKDPSEDSNASLEKSSSAVNVKRSPSILSKLARFQKKGMDIGVTDDSLNGVPFEQSDSSSEDASSSEEETNEEGGVVKSSRHKKKERPVSFGKMDDMKTKWESVGANGVRKTREELREERKEEIQRLRSRLFQGKLGKTKEMYEQAVMDSEKGTSVTSNGVKRQPSERARSLKERFEKGETGVDLEDASEDIRKEREELAKKAREEELSVFEAGISKKSRTLFLELDKAQKQQPPSIPTPTKSPLPKEEVRKVREVMTRQVSDDVVRASDRMEDVQVETADICNKFKFFETYQEAPRKKKPFRITPPREGQVKVGSPEREIYRDPNVVRSEDPPEDDAEVVVKSHTTTKMLSLFRQMEENANKDDVPEGPKPLKRFTPPPDYTRESESEEEEDEEDDEEEEDEEEEEEGQQEGVHDPNLVRASDKVEDEFLKQALSQNAARAKSLKAKFERWEADMERKGEGANGMIGDDETPSVDTTRNLRARFESMQSEAKNSAANERQSRPRVNRFV